MPVAVNTIRESSSVWANSPIYLVVILLVVFVIGSTFVSLHVHEAQGPHQLHEGGRQALLKKPIFSDAFNSYTLLLGDNLASTKVPEIQSQPVAPKCFEYFPPRCHIHPLIHYWDDHTDFYESPLRSHVGLPASPVHRKFVVFQPDLGGWNNIRMALEVVIVFAKVTGRILVLPPNAVLYLLVKNKKWGQNKSGMEDYFDFSKLRAGHGLETMSMNEFLRTTAAQGLLNLPLPDNNTDLMKQPLWDYLEKACETRIWAPGKTFIGFNISDRTLGHSAEGTEHLGDFTGTDPARVEDFTLKNVRKLAPYDFTLHSHRAIYFPGHDKNRLLTHFYSYLFMASAEEDRKLKRYVRDRLRYLFE